MSTELSENTKVTLDIKTISIIVSFVISLVAMYFTLQQDIELAKQLPEPQVSRTEFDLKDELVRSTIMNIQENVEENSDKLDKIDEKLYEIIENK